MEKSPAPTTPKNELQADVPFDFSKYTQPEVAEIPTGAPTGEAFDFSEYYTPEEKANRPADASAEAPADGVFDFSKYKPVPTAEEQIAEAERFRTWDFSDKNIAEKGPVRRDMTPDEIYEAGKAEAEKPARQRRIGSGVVRRLVSFGRRK